MNAKVKPARTAEQKAKDAERARNRRAAKKAVVTTEPVGGPSVEAVEDRTDNTDAPVNTPAVINPDDWQTIVVDGVDVKVKASLSPDEAVKCARKLMGRTDEIAEAKAAEAPETKPAKPVKLKGDPLATVFYRLSRTAMEALEGKPGAEYRKANADAWKVLKASKKITGGQSWAFTGNLRPEAASTLAAALRSIAGSEGFAKPGSLITNAAKLESNHYVAKAAEKR